jgi:hypothetical protein
MSTYSLPDAVAVSFAKGMTFGWKTETLTWDDFIQRLRKPATRVQKKNMPAFFGGGLKADRKRVDDVVHRDVIEADVDCGQHIEEIRNLLKGYECFIYASSSHLSSSTSVFYKDYFKFAPHVKTVESIESVGVAEYLMTKKKYPRDVVRNLIDEPVGLTEEDPDTLNDEKRFEVVHHPVEKYRIVFPLAKRFVVDASNTPEVWKRAILEFFKKLGLLVDEACAQLNRGFYMPARTEDGDDPFTEHLEGQAVDLDAVIAELPPEEPRKASNTPPGKGLPDHYQDVLNAIPSDERQDWLDVGMGLHHATGGSDEGLAIYHEWASTSGKNDPKVDQRTWSHFRSDRAKTKTWKSVERLARQHGWVPPGVVWPNLDQRNRPLKTSIPNIKAALDYLNYEFFYDEFADRHVIQGYKHLDDNLVRHIWLQVWKLDCQVNDGFFRACLCDIAEEDTRHPVCDYLDEVEKKWDGQPRFDKWLVTYAGAEDTAFNQAAGSLWMMAAVRRVRQPGVKFDNMLVFEGDEGINKSTMARLLAGDALFSDCLPIDADPKIVIEQTRGRWIIEFAELKDIKSKEVEGVKAFLSRTEDSARGAYGRIRDDVPRQFVTFGSTNDTAYLTGTTGNRRFWPVAVKTIDLEALKRDRDQLWAEAAVREAAGESIVLPESLWGVAREIQESRRVIDPLEERIVESLQDLEGIVTVDDLYAAIGLGQEDVSKRTARHGGLIKRTVERLGWTAGRKRIGGKKTSYYFKGNEDVIHKWHPPINGFHTQQIDPLRNPNPQPANVIQLCRGDQVNTMH